MKCLQRRIKLQEKSKKIKILFILSIILLTVILFLGVIINNMKNKKYSLENKTYYEVTLNPNNYFLNDKLKSYNYYIASSIKDINIYFNYYLKNKTKKNITYSYDITSTIKSYADNGTKLVWTKDFNLKNTNNKIEKEIKIDENYKLDYNIKTENYLYVRLNVKINDKDSFYVELTIPISEDIIEITMKEENTFLKTNKENFNLKIIIGFIIFAIFIIYLLSKILFNKNNEKTILKAYQDIIITTKNPDINTNNIIYLTNLKDLINIAINNNSNIFNYQNNYYAIIDNIYYIYSLKKST